MGFREFWDSCAQDNTSKISTNELLGIMGCLCAEQHVGNLKKCQLCIRSPNKAHVLALNAAHVLRLNKADVLALNRAHVLRLNTKICPVFTANTKEAAFGRLHKGVAALGRPFVRECCSNTIRIQHRWQPQGKALDSKTEPN